MSDAEKRFLLRLGPELYDALEQWAIEESRSVNAQIGVILRQAVAERRVSRSRDAQSRGIIEEENIRELDDVLA